MGSEYINGGGGCISTVEDCMRFTEALRVGDVVLGRETIRMMATDQLNDLTRPFYTLNSRHGYGLGVRCAKAGGQRQDFGWSGAAGAYLAIDPTENLSLFYTQHMLNSPNQKLLNFITDCVHKDLHPERELPEEARVLESILS